MRNSNLIKNALRTLTDTQQQLVYLLTNENVHSYDVITFLNGYDIDKETAVTSFLINDLLDRFDISTDTCASVPRIRGLEKYFRFQNATTLMKINSDELITNYNLYLKIRFSEDIRPFISCDSIDNTAIKRLVGKRYYEKLRKNVKTVQVQNREYFIPDDSFIPDILFLNLQILLLYSGNKDSILCSIYDIYRYGKNQKCSPHIRHEIYVRRAKKRIKKVALWLLKSKR